MSIFDVLKDRDSKKTFEEQNEAAIKMFDQQKGAIKGIETSEGYAEIKRFFEREKKIALERVMTAKKDDLHAKVQYQMADKFLEFLTIREK